MKAWLSNIFFRVIGISFFSLVLSVANAQTPTITSFTPTLGAISATVTITGQNFNATAANNIVFFGGTRAIVQAGSTATSLIVRVPYGANYNYISVTNLATRLTAYSFKPFVVTYSSTGLSDFGGRSIIPVSSNTTASAVYVGDLDRDGNLDVVVPDPDSGTLMIYENITSGGSLSLTLIATLNVGSGTSPQWAVGGDLDSDGYLDIVSSSYNSNVLSVFLNKTATAGSLSLSLFSNSLSTGNNPSGLAIRDLNNDGKPDIVVTNYNSSTVSVFQNTYAGGILNFNAKVDFSTNSNPRSVAIGDLDANGLPDLLVTNVGGNVITVLRNTSAIGGTINFTAGSNLSTLANPQSLVIGDLDLDNKLDVAFVQSGGNVVSIYRNTSVSGTISFGSRIDLPASTTPFSIAIGDMNGDGKPDLSVANNGAGTASVFRNNSVSGSITFSVRVDYTTASNPSSIAVGDLNNDGMMEMVALGAGNLTLWQNVIIPPAPVITTVNPLSGTLGSTVIIGGRNFDPVAANNVVFFGAVTATIVGIAGSTTLTVTVPKGATYQYVSVVNLTSDLVGYSARPFVVTYPTTGVNTFGVKREQAITNNSSGTGVVIADFDRDGLPDVVIPNVDASTFTVYSNTSSTTTIVLTPLTPISTGGSAAPRSVATGDLNGDGYLDIVVGNYNLNTLVVFLNTTAAAGSLSFTLFASLATTSNPTSVVIGDLNNDGRPDIAATNYNSISISLFRNLITLGTLSFDSKVDIAVGGNPNSIAIGDLDANGLPDLAVANVGYNNITILRNVSPSQGALNFTTATTLNTSNSPYSLALGDLDLDNRLDITVVNGGNGFISTFRNTSVSGTFSFGTRADYTSGTTPYWISVGDIDGDGKPDVVAANNASNTASVFKNTSVSGTISLVARVDYPVATSPFALGLADLNGLGMLDIVAVGSASLSVLLNINIPPAPVITSVNPLSATVGSTITLVGRNFDTTASNNMVYFGSTPATVVGVSGSTTLTVTVPAGANYQYISVTSLVTNLTGYSARPFVVTYSTDGFNDYATRIDFATTNNSSSAALALGDFDQDGYPDIVTTNVDASTFTVYLNVASGASVSLTSGFVLSTGSSAAPRSVAVGDFDGDGALDIAIGNYNLNTVSVFLNRTTAIGNLNFTLGATLTTGSAPLGMSVGDFNNDGRPDLAVANYSSNTVSVFRNSTTMGNVSFDSKVDFATNSNPCSVAIGDLDGNGLVDMVVANYSSNVLSLFRNTSPGVGTLSFVTLSTLSTLSNPYAVAMADIDLDGRLELISTSGGNTIVGVFRNTSISGTVSFATRADFATGTLPYNIAVGDVNGDGRPDLAIANNTANTVSVLRSSSTSGSISFGGKIDYVVPTSPFAVVLGDLNLDGMLEMATVGSTSLTVFRNIIIPLEPLITSFSPITGNVGAVVTLTGQNFDPVASNNVVFFGATAATVTGGTGTTSLSVMVPPGATYQYISVTSIPNKLTGYSPLPFNPTFSAATNTISFTIKTDFTITNNSSATMAGVGDFDQDGIPDVVIPNVDAGTLTIYRNVSSVGSVSFTPALVLSTGGSSSPRAVAVGDFDGDGALDLVVANYNLNTLSIFLNRTTAVGSFSFTLFSSSLVTGSNPIAVAVGDLNMDGRVDIVATNYGANTVSLFRNTYNLGSLTFDGKVDVAVGNNPNSVAIGDIDNNGWADIAVANLNSNTISILKNISPAVGALNFTLVASPGTSNNPYTVALGDLDLDGRMDLAVANGGNTLVSVFRNTSVSGTFNFGSRADYTTGSFPIWVSIGDLNGDGRPELTVANRNSNTVSVFRSTSVSGTIGFSAKTDFATASSPFAVTLADYDLDGELDIATTATGIFSVIRNASSGGAITISSFSPLYVLQTGLYILNGLVLE